jgi:riboflavin kinase
VLPKELGVGVYYGVVALDPATAPAPSSSESTSGDAAPILPAVLSIGYNPYYKNKTRSIVSFLYSPSVLNYLSDQILIPFSFSSIKQEIHIMPSLTLPSPTARSEEKEKFKFHKLPDFYGTKLNLLMLGYIRPEYDYVSMEALVEDIRIDCEVARASLLRPAYRVYLDGNEDEKVSAQRDWLRSF